MFRLCPAALAVLVLFGGCSSSPSSPTEPPTPLTVTRFAANPQTSLTYFSGLAVTERRVVRDQAAWREIWSAIYRTQTPEPPLPVVDFTREMVVVAALGEQLTGGVSILVASASETSAGVTVDIRTVLPGRSCATPSVVNQPVDAARLPRRDASVVFNTRLETQECQ